MGEQPSVIEAALTGNANYVLDNVRSNHALAYSTELKIDGLSLLQILVRKGCIDAVREIARIVPESLLLSQRSGDARFGIIFDAIHVYDTLGLETAINCLNVFEEWFTTFVLRNYDTRPMYMIEDMNRNRLIEHTWMREPLLCHIYDKMRCMDNYIFDAPTSDSHAVTSFIVRNVIGLDASLWLYGTNFPA